ncbi:MAG: hypothetical protein ACFCUV_22390 [Rivularia sp. (in: cyanobacteria)]
MTKRQFSLNKASRECADRILAQTGIESYSELFSLLLRRYEKDFIKATNGFFFPAMVTNGDKRVQTASFDDNQIITNGDNGDKRVQTASFDDNQMVTNGDKRTQTTSFDDSQMVTNGDERVQTTPNGLNSVHSLPDKVAPQPKKTAKQRLMDFED